MFPESRLEQLDAETLESYELKTLGTEDLICFQCKYREEFQPLQGAANGSEQSERFSEKELESLDNRRLRL
tara:strand:- start:281 stop:493 length:213 start_codon:yes stop_codon:yes gene_type:complete